jgi:exodeoxyribonuclease X
MTKILVVDTETNGREPPEVVELAYTELLERGWGRISDVLTFRFKPSKNNTVGALSTHHILDYELAGCRPSAEARLPEETTHIIGHQVDYDWGALGKPRVKRICTLAIARSLYPELDSHKLGAVLYHLADMDEARDRLKDAHAAEVDVLNCFLILQLMIDEAGLDFASADSLWEFSEKCRVPTIMPFGKHKGVPIAGLPHDYKAWCLRQKDMDEYVVKAIKATL